MTTRNHDGAETDTETARDRYEAVAEKPVDETSGNIPGVGRRPLLKALGAGGALSIGSGVATADDDEGESDTHETDGGKLDQAEGFEAEVVAPHATFSDDVAAALGVTYEDGVEDSAFVHDASTVVVVRVTLAPGGTSGWHLDRGPVIGNVVEGEIDVTFEDECATHTYAAGEALVATGAHADIVGNASDTEQAVAYLIFLGVPDGESPSKSVEPPDCWEPVRDAL